MPLSQMRLLTDIEDFIVDSADLILPAALVVSGLSLLAMYAGG